MRLFAFACVCVCLRVLFMIDCVHSCVRVRRELHLKSIKQKLHAHVHIYISVSVVIGSHINATGKLVFMGSHKSAICANVAPRVQNLKKLSAIENWLTMTIGNGQQSQSFISFILFAWGV